MVGGTHCPYCGSTNVQSGAKHKTMPYRCREKECAKRFSVRTKTPMESSKLGFQVWAVALYQVTTNLKGVSSMKLHRDLGITGSATAWHLAAASSAKSFKDHGMAKMAGPVEADETYIGGLEKEQARQARSVVTLARGGTWENHRRRRQGSRHESRQCGGRIRATRMARPFRRIRRQDAHAKAELRWSIRTSTQAIMPPAAITR